MQRVVLLSLAFMAASTACDPPSKLAGTIEDEDRVSHAEIAQLACEAQQNCCEDPVVNVDCVSEMAGLLDHQSELAAEHELQRDASCFEQLGECGPTKAEQATSCEVPCKLFAGSAGVGEPCKVIETATWIDTCAQGLMCARDPESPLGQEGSCEDPCASERAGKPCTAANELMSCGVDAFCDAPFEDEPVGECQPRRAVGSSCDPSKDSCLPDSFCDADAPDGPTCVPVLEDGRACSSDRSCRSRRCGDETTERDVGVCEPSLTDWCYEGRTGDVLIPE